MHDDVSTNTNMNNKPITGVFINRLHTVESDPMLVGLFSFIRVDQPNTKKKTAYSNYNNNGMMIIRNRSVRVRSEGV